MSDELRECPFCGGAAEVQSYEAPTVPIFYWVVCTVCQVDTPLQNVVTEQDARNAWNRRTVDKGILEALSFAKSVILSGEEWTETCERVIQGAINRAKGVK